MNTFPAAYYKLSPSGKRLFLIGMPIRYCTQDKIEISFKNFKARTSVISSVEQGKYFKSLQENGFSSGVGVIASNPNNEDAFKAVRNLLLSWDGALKTDSYMIFDLENPPDRKEILSQQVLITTLNQDDMQSKRSKVRSFVYGEPRGVGKIIILTAEKPLEYMEEKIGIVPDFLLQVMSAGKTVG